MRIHTNTGIDREIEAVIAVCGPQVYTSNGKSKTFILHAPNSKDSANAQLACDDMSPVPVNSEFEPALLVARGVNKTNI
jgi:hypothetical protein